MTTYTIDTSNISTIDTTNRIVPIGFVLKLKRTNLKTRYRVFEKENDIYKEKNVNEEQKYPGKLNIYTGWNLMGNYFPNTSSNSNNSDYIYYYDISNNVYFSSSYDESQLSKEKGHWVYSDKDMEFYNTDNSSNLLPFNEGWNLSSFSQDILVSNLRIQYPRVSYIYEYNNIINNYVLKESNDMLIRGIGFWILIENE